MSIIVLRIIFIPLAFLLGMTMGLTIWSLVFEGMIFKLLMGFAFSIALCWMFEESVIKYLSSK